MRIGVPSPSSRMHDAATRAASELFRISVARETNSRTLSAKVGEHCVTMCRGFDMPTLVEEGLLDAGLTGYDAAVEYVLARGGQNMLEIRHLGPWRQSYVVLASAAKEEPPFSVLFTEYPAITSAWQESTGLLTGTRVVRTRGSTEGVLASERGSAGVFLTTTGASLRDNDLEVYVPILATDLCVITRRNTVSRVCGIPLGRFPRADAPSFCRHVWSDY